jgi:hypothetical protein
MLCWMMRSSLNFFLLETSVVVISTLLRFSSQSPHYEPEPLGLQGTMQRGSLSL